MVLKLFRPATEPEERKASAAQAVFAVHGAGRAAWSPRDNTSMTRTGFIQNPVGFRCIKMISESAAVLPILVQDADRRYTAHPVLELLARPNPTQGQTALFEAMLAQLLLYGDAYVEAAGESMRGGPQELYVLRGDRMRVVPGRDGWPVAYEYAVGASKHRFDARAEPSPVLHIRSFHPLDDHYGLSPMQAAAAAVDVHNSASRWSKALLDNAARPSGAIVYKGADGQGALASDQYARLVEELETHHQGARNAGRPMLLEGGLDWKPMGFSPSDMEFHKTKEAAAREIALAFGVPPMLLGLPGDNTYSNYQEANRAFFRQCVLPAMGRVLAALNGWLSPRYGEGLKLSVDMDNVPALGSEREAQWRRIAEAGFLSDDEKRSLLGLPRLADTR